MTPKKAKPAARKTAKAPAKPGSRAALQRVKMVGDLERARKYLHAVEELGGRIHPLMTETELVGRFERALEALFPDAAWVLRTKQGAHGDLLLRAHSPKALLLGGETAGMQAVKTGLVVHLVKHPMSETAPGGKASVFPLQVGFHLLGYLEVEVDPKDSEGLRVLEMLSGQLAIAMRTLQSTEESRTLEKHLASVADNANSVVVLTSSDGRIRFFNKQAEALSGYRRDEMYGKSLLRVFKFHKGDRDRLRRAIADSLAGIPVPNFEARYVTKHDEVRFALFNSAPLYDAKQNQTGIVLTGVDLTEHKFLERQIVHTEKLASLGEMAAGVAHELNNPLTSIYTSADLQLRLARKDGREESEVRRLESILEGAERIKNLVRNLMGYVRQSNEEMVALDINGLTEQALSFCNYELTRSGVVLRRELQEGIPPVRGIASQVQQVLVNLLLNASHAMVGRPGAVTLRSQASGDKVILEVEDTGAGIRQEDLEKICTPFYTTKPEGKGTGLGLSIVNRILENHGARMEIRSEVNVGSCFRVVFQVAATS